MRIFFTFFLLLTGHFLRSQDLSPEMEVREVDSLVTFSRYDMAVKKADSLLLVLESGHNKPELTEPKLQLLLLKAKIYEKKEENDKALQILLNIIGPASSGKFYTIACRANIIFALIYEKKGDYVLSREYLNAADKIRIQHNLEELYSSILIRRSLYHRFVTKDIDSADYYARKARGYAEKHHIAYDVAAASGMIGIYEAHRENYPEAIANSLTAVRYYIKTNDYDGASLGYANISKYYWKIHHMEAALLYCDSAYIFSGKTPFRTQHVIAKYRFQLFEANHHMDSALFYLKKTYDLRDSVVMEEEAVKIKQITEQYQNDKKEEVIKNKNRQIVLVISLFVIIAVAAALLVRSNRKIRSQNKIISRQVEELMKMLDQKQMLLSELQHRVKNNLQHVISILEIQKESVDFNNIDELIRGNQNRIHSMALLHKKLHVSETVNEVGLKRYVTELAELVKDSYDTHKKKVQLNMTCDIEKMSIEQALPVGLIIVELVSNSMKHAFKNRGVGMIHIEIVPDEPSGKNRLYYADNGKGFDFNRVAGKGLGLEIIKGLIDQLDGTVETGNTEGFELTVLF